MSSFSTRTEQVAAVAARYADAVDREGRFPHETLRALKEARLLGIMVPRDGGGEAASLEDVAEICAGLGQHCASSAMIFAMHQIKVSSLVSHGVTSDWHRAFMRRIVDEQLLWGLRPRRPALAETFAIRSARWKCSAKTTSV